MSRIDQLEHQGREKGNQLNSRNSTDIVLQAENASDKQRLVILQPQVTGFAESHPVYDY